MTESTISLIDLSTDESSDLLISVPPLPLPDDMIISSNANKRDSLENNPFDQALKQMVLLNDPFEIVFNEQRKQLQSSIPSNVETGNLICTDENIVTTEIQLETLESNVQECNNISKPIADGSSFESHHCLATETPSPIDNTVEVCSNVSELASTSSLPSSLNKVILSSPLSMAMSDSSLRAMNYTLLNQQSLTAKRSPFFGTQFTKSPNGRERNNSDGSTPVSGFSPIKDTKTRSSSLDATAQRLKLLKLSFTNSPRQTAVNLLEESVFHSSKSFGNQSMQRSNEDSFEDQVLMDEQPNFVDSDADSDIEQMRIPFLKHKCAKGDPDSATTTSIFVDQLEKYKMINLPCEPAVVEKTQPEIILESKTPSPTNNATHINTLLGDLKKAVDQCENVQAKSDASALLTNLSVILQSGQLNDEHLWRTPNPIRRQGTFNLDAEDNDDRFNDQNSADSCCDLIESDQPHKTLLTNKSPLSQAIRSKSLTAQVKPQSVMAAIQAKKEVCSNGFATPTRPMAQQRRNSFSAARSFDRPNLTRRSILPTSNEQPKTNASVHFQTPPSSKTRLRQSIAISIRSTKQQSFPGDRIPQFGVVDGSRLRVRASESKSSATGPLKATIPIRAVQPLHVASSNEVKQSIPSTPNANHYKPCAYSTPLMRVAGGTSPHNSNIGDVAHKIATLSTPVKGRPSHMSVTPNPVRTGRIGRHRTLTNTNAQSLQAAASNSFGSGKLLDPNSVVVRNQHAAKMVTI